MIDRVKSTRTRRFLAAAAVIVVLPCAMSDMVPDNSVKAAVTTWVRYVAPDSQPTAEVVLMEPISEGGRIIAYIAHLEPRGFCICGADECVLPVYLYNPYGAYDESHPGYRTIVDDIRTRSNGLRGVLSTGNRAQATIHAQLMDRAAYWQDLIAGEPRARSGSSEHSRATPSSLELPLQSKWHQRAPYNNDCPLGVDGVPCVVGCVATAMVQVMRYWEWPPAGSHGWLEYEWDGDDSCEGGFLPGETLGAFLNAPYDWGNMPLEDPADGYTAAQEAALAELCLEAGVSLRMDYGNCGSSASTAHIEDALEDFFLYSTDARYDSANVDDLTTELLWYRPVTMRGGRWNGDGWEGHCFVVYGYDTTSDPDRSFLINMGWGASDWHVWYTFDSIPFYDNKKYVRRIAPDFVVRFIGASSNGDGSPDDPYRDIAEALQEAPDQSTWVFEAGSSHVHPGDELVIDRTVTLIGRGVTITSEY